MPISDPVTIQSWLNSIPKEEFTKTKSGHYYTLAESPNGLCLVRERYGKRIAIEVAVIDRWVEEVQAGVGREGH